MVESRKQTSSQLNKMQKQSIEYDFLKSYLNSKIKASKYNLYCF